jgi:DNA-binding FadR family transcriptional regulator
MRRQALDEKLATVTVPGKRSNLHVSIANILGEEIVRGEVAVGSLIPNEAELCVRFAVSRTVVREAVKLLISKGLLKSHAGVGTWVLPPSEWNFLDPAVFSWVKETGNVDNLIQNLFAFRQAIEPAAAAEAARNANAEQVATMKRALDIMCIPNVDFRSWIEADVDFHTAIYIGSNNVFMSSLASLFREYFQMSFKVSSSNNHHQHCLQEHIDVYQAIADKRPADALQAVLTLLNHAHEDVRMVAAQGDAR